MRFALINNKQAEAESGLKGFCAGCAQPVIAKCGTQRVHHWAHSSNAMCDSWWEQETEWHRAWKNNFPDDWQEIFMLDKRTGEKHIADIRTRHGLVVEFQHSHIDFGERKAREQFYQNMVWVVDGGRLKRDYQRFIKEGGNWIQSLHNGMFKVYNLEKCFPKEWLHRPVPVIFDFSRMEVQVDWGGGRGGLFCLFPGWFGDHAKLAEISRKAFTKHVISGEWS